MKRKKFVKQLMSMGYDRNGADAAARALASRGVSYEQFLGFVKIGYRSRTYLSETVADMHEILHPAVAAFSEVIRKLTEAFCALYWEAIGEDFANRMESLNAMDYGEREHNRADILDALNYSGTFALDACRQIGGGGCE